MESNHVDFELLQVINILKFLLKMEKINSGKMFYMPWQYILSKTTTVDSWASFLHNPIWYNNKLKINHAFSTKTGIERVSG